MEDKDSKTSKSLHFFNLLLECGMSGTKQYCDDYKMISFLLYMQILK